MVKHRLLVFHGQDALSGADHVALSEAFGSLDHGLHRPHPRAPDPRLLRVSNDEAEGFVSVGTSGWHVDGVMLRAPFAVQTMHFLSSISGGDTLFLGLNELLGAMSADLRERCRRLWFVSGVGANLFAGEGQLSLLPLVHVHPETGQESMCFHLGPGYCIGWVEEQPAAEGLAGLLRGLVGGGSAGPAAERTLGRLLAGPGAPPGGFQVLPPGPTQELITGLIDRLSAETRARALWRQDWAAGDFALIDNLALAHLPAPGTQAKSEGPEGKGLRLFHRTTMVDEGAVLTSVRGVRSVLLASRPQGGPEAPKSSSAVADVDPGAMRDILSALLQATQGDGAGAGAKRPAPAPAAKGPSTSPGGPPPSGGAAPPAASGAVVQRLRAKAAKAAADAVR